MSKRILICMVVGLISLGAILRVGWSFSGMPGSVGGDAYQYFILAAHLQRDHVLSFDGVQPQAIRLPGYPVFLSIFTNPASALDPTPTVENMHGFVRRAAIANAVLDLSSGIVAGLFIALVTSQVLRRSWAIACGLIATTLWFAQPWTTLVALRSLSDTLATFLTTVTFALAAWTISSRRVAGIFATAVVAGLALLVRLDSVVLLPAVLAVPFFCVSGARRRLRMIALAGGVWLATFSPWPLRNLITLGDVTLFAGNVDSRGQLAGTEPVFRWIKTWGASEVASTSVGWRFPGVALSLDELPRKAIDSPYERMLVGQVLAKYNQRLRMDEELARDFDRLADYHRANHRYDYYVRLPLKRVRLLLFPPRDGFGMGSVADITPFRRLWIGLDRMLILLGIVGLGLVTGWVSVPVGILLAAPILLRLLLFAWWPTPEPRYMFEVLPMFYALAAATPFLLWKGIRPEPLP